MIGRSFYFTDKPFKKTIQFIMATPTTKVTAGEVVSATVKYTNLDDDSRKFNISADVNIQNKKATGFNSGAVAKKDSTDYSNATFSAGQDFNYFSFNSNNLKEGDIKEALEETLAFIANVQKNVESYNVE